MSRANSLVGFCGGGGAGLSDLAALKDEQARLFADDNLLAAKRLLVVLPDVPLFGLGNICLRSHGYQACHYAYIVATSLACTTGTVETGLVPR